MKTKIKEYRAKKDFTQKELADKVGIRRETVLHIEKGRYNPSLKLAHRIAEALNSSIEELFIFEEEKNNSQ
ncbi:MAG: helix-turn-helix transcriptional regulator [Candidatus Hadarchaeia archaeon]